METRGERYKSGDECETGGTYVFDGYTDGTSEPEPTEEEREIELEEGDTFPPIRSGRKGAWWRLDEGEDEDVPERDDEFARDEESD
jgi:hypothetical protein